VIVIFNFYQSIFTIHQQCAVYIVSHKLYLMIMNGKMFASSVSQYYAIIIITYYMYICVS